MIPLGLAQQVTNDQKPKLGPPKPTKPKVSNNLATVMAAVDMHLGTKQGDPRREAIKSYILSKDPTGNDAERLSHEALAAQNPLMDVVNPAKPQQAPRQNPIVATAQATQRQVEQGNRAKAANEARPSPSLVQRKVAYTQPITGNQGFDIKDTRNSSLEAEMAAYDRTHFGGETFAVKPKEVNARNWAARQQYRAKVAKANGWDGSGRNKEVAGMNRAIEAGKPENMTPAQRLEIAKEAAGNLPGFYDKERSAAMISKILGESPNIGEQNDAGVALSALNQATQPVSTGYTLASKDPRAMQELPGVLQGALTLGDIAAQFASGAVIGGEATAATSLGRLGQLATRYLAMDAPGYAQMIRDSGGADKALIQFGAMIKDSLDPTSKIPTSQRIQGLALAAALTLGVAGKVSSMRGVKAKAPDVTPESADAVFQTQIELVQKGASPEDALNAAKVIHSVAEPKPSFLEEGDLDILAPKPKAEPKPKVQKAKTEPKAQPVKEPWQMTAEDAVKSDPSYGAYQELGDPDLIIHHDTQVRDARFNSMLDAIKRGENVPDSAISEYVMAGQQSKTIDVRKQIVQNARRLAREGKSPSEISAVDTNYVKESIAIAKSTEKTIYNDGVTRSVERKKLERQLSEASDKAMRDGDKWARDTGVDDQARVEKRDELTAEYQNPIKAKIAEIESADDAFVNAQKPQTPPVKSPEPVESVQPAKPAETPNVRKPTVAELDFMDEPKPKAEPKPEPKAEAAKPKEAWEMTRGKVKGEKPEVRTNGDIEPGGVARVNGSVKISRRNQVNDTGWYATLDDGTVIATSKDKPTVVRAAKEWAQRQSDNVARNRHRGEVKQALSEGKPVPAEVLADYPDLQPKTTPVKASEKPVESVQPAKPVETPTVRKPTVAELDFMDEPKPKAVKAPKPEPKVETPENAPFPINARGNRTSINGAVAYPRSVGAKFSTEEIASVKEWGQANGYHINATPTKISIIGDSGGAIADSINSAKSLTKAEVESKAKLDAYNTRQAQTQAENAKTVSSNAGVWLDSTFGADFANDFNKAALVRFIEGKDAKFQGGASRKWADGLEKLGIIPDDAKVALSKIKEAYEASQPTKSAAAKANLKAAVSEFLDESNKLGARWSPEQEAVKLQKAINVAKRAAEYGWATVEDAIKATAEAFGRKLQKQEERVLRQAWESVHGKPEPTKHSEPATPIKPPKPPQNASVEPEAPNKGYQGFTHADVETAMNELGNPTRERNPKSDTTLKAEAQKLAPKAEQIANDYDGSRPLSDAEQIAVGAKFSEVKSQYTELKLKLLEAGEPIEGNAQLNELNQRLIKLARATDEAGTEWGRSGRARQALIKAGGDIDLADIDSVIFKAAYDRGVSMDDLSPDLVANLTKHVEALTKENEALKARQEAVTTAKAEAAASRSRTPRGGRTVEVVRAEKAVAVQNLKDALRKAGTPSSVGSGLGAFESLVRHAPEVGKALVQVIKLHVEEFKIVKLDKAFYDAIRKEVGEITDANGNKIELTDSDIRSTWAGFYDETSGTKAGAENTLAKLKTQAGLVERIERALTGGEQPPITRRVKDKEIQKLQNQLRALLPTVDNAASRARIQETITKLELQKASGERDGVKPRHVTNQDLRDIVQSLRKDLRLDDKIKDLTHQLETGDFKGPDPRVEKLTAEQAKQKAKIKGLQARVNAAIKAQGGRTWSDKISGFITNNVLMNPIARVKDVVNNSLKLGQFIVESGVRVPTNYLLERAFHQPNTGRELVIRNYRDALSGLANRIKGGWADTWAGTSPEALKYGRGSLFARVTGLTDVPFNQFYQSMAIYDLAHAQAIKELGKGAGKEAIANRRRAIMADPPQEMLDVALDFALRQTYNSQNVAGNIQRGVATSGIEIGKARDKATGTGRTVYHDNAKLAGTLMETPVRFSKVIGNVVAEKLDHTPIGLLKAMKETAVMMKAGYSPQSARLISDLTAKGLIGTAMLAAGYYKATGDEPGKPDIVKTSNGFIFLDFGPWADAMPGAASAYMLGRAIKEIQDMVAGGQMTQKQADKAISAAGLGLIMDQPLFSGIERVGKVQDANSAGKFGVDILFTNFMPGSSLLRQAAKIDDSIYRDLKAGEPINLGSALQEKRVKVSNPADQFMKNVPVLRRGLPLADDEKVNAKSKSSTSKPKVDYLGRTR